MGELLLAESLRNEHHVIFAFSCRVFQYFIRMRYLSFRKCATLRGHELSRVLPTPPRPEDHATAAQPAARNSRIGLRGAAGPQVRHLARTGTTVIDSANPGCSAQLEAGLRQASSSVRVAHPIVLFAEAIGNTTKPNGRPQLTCKALRA